MKLLKSRFNAFSSCYESVDTKLIFDYYINTFKIVVAIYAKNRGKAMKSITCEKCGANEWDDQNGYRICKYCGTAYQLTKEDITITKSNISISDDIMRLLQMCQLEPRNAKKYANLILDIDPNNVDALKYL